MFPQGQLGGKRFVKVAENIMGDIEKRLRNIDKSFKGLIKNKLEMVK